MRSGNIGDQSSVINPTLLNLTMIILRYYRRDQYTSKMISYFNVSESPCKLISHAIILRDIANTRSGNLRQFLRASNHVKTQKLGFKPWKDRRTPFPIGYKFRFTQLNWVCLVLPWLDAKRKLLKFPIQVIWRCT